MSAHDAKQKKTKFRATLGSAQDAQQEALATAQAAATRRLISVEDAVSPPEAFDGEVGSEWSPPMVTASDSVVSSVTPPGDGAISSVDVVLQFDSEPDGSASVDSTSNT